MKMLTFLKRSKGAKKHVKGRLINIGISSMQFLATLCTYGCLMVNMGQEKQLGMITKTFAALGIIMGVDDSFANYLPKSIKENANLLNSSGLLKMP